MTLSRLAGSQSLKLTVLCHVTTERSQQLSSYNPFIYQSSETSSTFSVTHIEYPIFIILTNAVHSPLVVHKNHVKGMESAHLTSSTRSYLHKCNSLSSATLEKTDALNPTMSQ